MLTYAMEVHDSVLKDSCKPVESMAETHIGQNCLNTVNKFENSSNTNCAVDTIGLTNLDIRNVSMDESKVIKNEYPSRKITLQECSVVLCRLSNEELNSRLLKVQTPRQLAVLPDSDDLSQTQSPNHPEKTCKARKRGRQKMNADFHTELNAKKLKISSELRNDYKVNVNRALTKFRSLDRFFLMNKSSRKFEVAKPRKFKAKKFSDTKISDYFTHDAARNKLDLCDSTTIGSIATPFDAEIENKMENSTHIDEIMKERNGISKDLRVCLINLQMLGISSPPYIASEVEKIIADYASFSRYPVRTKVMHGSAVDKLCQNVKSNFSHLRMDKTKGFINSSLNLTSKTEKDNVFTNSSRKKRNQKNAIIQFCKTPEDPVSSSSQDSATNETAPIESAYNEKSAATNNHRHRHSLEDSAVRNLQSDDLGTLAQIRSNLLSKALARVKSELDSGKSLDEIRLVPDEIASPNFRLSTNDERVNSTMDQSQRRSSTRPKLSVARLCCKTVNDIESTVTDFSKNIESCETSKIQTTPKKGSNVVQRLEIQSNEECIIAKKHMFTSETERIDEVLSSDDVTIAQKSVEPSKDTNIPSSESYSRKSVEKSIEEIRSIIGVTPKSRTTPSLSAEESSHSTNKEINQLNVIDKLKHLLSQACPDHRDKFSADVGTKMSTELQIEPADSTSTIDLPMASDIPISPKSLPVVEPMVNPDKSKDTVSESNVLEEPCLPMSQQNRSPMTDERVADSVDADFNRENEKNGIIYKRKCSICDQLFTSPGMLKKHLSNHFKDEELQQCTICDQPLKNSIVHHYFKHCTLIVVCPTCNKVFKHKGLLRLHMISEKHGRDLKRWKCDVCSMTCDSKEDLFLHVLTHSTTDLQDAYQAKTNQQSQDGKKKNENTKTDLQKEGDIDVDEATSHIVVQEKTKTSVELASCEPDIETLNGSTSSRKSTERMVICPCHSNHQPEISSGIIIEIATACQQCNMLFKTNECFKKHLAENKTCYENLENKTSAKIYCGSCCLVLHSLQEMHSHLESHTQKQMKVFVLCKLCRVMFYGMGPMFYTHWFNHCKDSKYCADPDSFPEHMKVAVFNINSVNKILTQNIFIADHVCTLCKSPFYSEQELKKHSNTDTKTCAGSSLELSVKERYRQSFKLMCSICNEEFSAKSLLDDHVRSHETVGDLLQVPEYYVDHTSGNRFVCKICKTTLNSAAECDDHSLKHKVIQEKFVCGICIVMFDNMDDFENHLSSHKKSLKKLISCQIVFATCKYYCKKCKLLFQDGDSLHQHSMDHAKSLLPIDTWNQQTVVPSSNDESSTCKTSVINEIHRGQVPETAAKCSRVETQINDKVDEVEIHRGQVPETAAKCSRVETQINDKVDEVVEIHRGQVPETVAKCSRVETQINDKVDEVVEIHRGQVPETVAKCPKVQTQINDKVDEVIEIHCGQEPETVAKCSMVETMINNKVDEVDEIHRGQVPETVAKCSRVETQINDKVDEVVEIKSGQVPETVAQCSRVETQINDKLDEVVEIHRAQVPETVAKCSRVETQINDKVDEVVEIKSGQVPETVAKCSSVETQIDNKFDEVVDKSVKNSEQADCDVNDATRQSPANERAVPKPSFLRVKKLSDLIEQKHECNICKTKFSTQYLLTHHRCDQRGSVPEIVSKPAKEIFICQVCGMYETTDPLQLRIHVMLHFPLDAYPKLNECWYSAWRISTGKHHLKCKLCQNFQTPSIAVLQEHFLVVHATIYQPMFKCRMCRDFMTFDSHKIQLHERTHFVSSSDDELPNFIRNNVKILSSRPGTLTSQTQATSLPIPKLGLIYRCPICNNFECTSEQQLQAHYSTQHSNDVSRIKLTSESSQNRTPSSGSCSSENQQPRLAQMVPHQSALGVLKQNGTPTVTVQVINKPSIRADVISIPRLPKPTVSINQQRWRLIPDQNLYPYSCSLCFCRFLHEAEFLQHQREVHPPAGITTNTSNMFQCDLCNLCSMSVDQLQFHKRVQHGLWY